MHFWLLLSVGGDQMHTALNLKYDSLIKRQTNAIRNWNANDVKCVHCVRVHHHHHAFT